MNLIIEVIDGVAYTVEEANNYLKACAKCCFDGKCNTWCVQRHNAKTYYRRLTATEREEVVKAMGRGME